MSLLQTCPGTLGRLLSALLGCLILQGRWDASASCRGDRVYPQGHCPSPCPGSAQGDAASLTHSVGSAQQQDRAVGSPGLKVLFAISPSLQRTGCSFLSIASMCWTIIFAGQNPSSNSSWNPAAFLFVRQMKEKALLCGQHLLIKH